MSAIPPPETLRFVPLGNGIHPRDYLRPAVRAASTDPRPPAGAQILLRHPRRNASCLALVVGLRVHAPECKYTREGVGTPRWGHRQKPVATGRLANMTTDAAGLSELTHDIEVAMTSIAARPLLNP